MKIISSNRTLFFKYILPILLLIVIILFSIHEFLNHNYLIILLLIIIFLFNIIFFINIKYVAIDDQYIIISNYFKNIKVHRSNIAKVYQSVFRTHKIYIFFNCPTEFGNKISFLPTLHINDIKIFTEHPIVDELRNEFKGIIHESYDTKINNYCPKCNKIEINYQSNKCSICGNHLTNI